MSAPAGCNHDEGGRAILMACRHASLSVRPDYRPPFYREQLDYEVIEDGRSIGRMYEDWHALPRASLFLVYHCIYWLQAGRDDTRPGAGPS